MKHRGLGDTPKGGAMIELMTVEEVAKILRSSKWFIYKNADMFGGVRFGKLIRFPKETFETKLKELIKRRNYDD
jgi:excisionase family DNA binding protein